jgi:hypothetical protein
MADSLACLRLHAVICCHNDDCDISHACTAGTHRAERLVAWRVQEADGAVFTIDCHFYVVRSNRLSYKEGTAGNNPVSAAGVLHESVEF